MCPLNALDKKEMKKYLFFLGLIALSCLFIDKSGVELSFW